MSDEANDPSSLDLPGEILQLPVDRVEVNPYQPRREFDPEGLAELAESIRRYGVLQPVVARWVGNRYQLVAGERRLRAARMAGLSQVPGRLCQYTDSQMLEVALVENLQREDIGPLEAAEAYRQLSTQFRLTQEQIAQRVGKSRSAVANTMRLLGLPPFIQQSLQSGEITEGHARALLGVGDLEQQKKLWEQIVLAGASVREAEQLTRTPPGTAPAGTRSTDRPPADPNMAAVESALRQTLGTRVTLNPGRRGGTITIEYYGNEDLERIVGAILGSEVLP